MTNYLIDFVDDASQEEVTAYLVANSCNVERVFNALNKVYLVSSATLPPTTDKISSIINDDENPVTLLDIITTEPRQTNRSVTITVADEKEWWKIYSLSTIDLAFPSADVLVYGLNTCVYLVDSGIDITHSDFTNRPVDLVHSFTGEFSDSTGHGTALSSVIVGATCGFADTTLKVVKIFDKNQATKQSDMLGAFDAILTDHFATPNTFSVVNLSWAIPKNEYIENKIRLLIQAGLMVVVASGNSGVPITDVTPASMPEVITVGSYGINFVPSDFTSFTDPGITSLTQNQVNTGILDSWAPGEKIWAAGPNDTYGFTSGTSVAAAIYSASVAYNATKWLTPTGDIGSFIREPSGIVRPDYFVKFDRSGILDLSDPKYSSSANRICTFVNSSDLGGPIKSHRSSIAVKVGEAQAISLFRRNKVSAYEWLTPLPSFVTDDVGILNIYPTTEPADSNMSETFELEVSVTPIEEGSAPVRMYLSILVLKSTFDPATLPADDPLLEISLLINGENCIAHAPTTCSTFNDCNAGFYCTSTSLVKVCYCHQN